MLWLATEDGVWRVDGDRARQIAVGDRRVTHIASSPDLVLAAVPHAGLFAIDAKGERRVWMGDARSCAIARDGTLFVGAEPAMVYRSHDGGRSWDRLDGIDELATRPNWTFPPPPHEPHVLSIDFIAGRPTDVLAGIEVGGVIRSFDGGDRWTELNDGVYVDVHSVRPDPSSPNALFAVTGAGFYASDDGGACWEKRMDGMDEGYTVGLSVHPTNAGELLVASGTRPPGQNCHVYHSTDDGRHWQRISDEGLPERFGRAPVPLLTADEAWLGAEDGSLYRAEDPLGSWELCEGIPVAINAMAADGSPSSVMH